MVYQSVIDMCASLLTLVGYFVEVDGTRMSPTSVFDQFVCHVWLTGQHTWYFIVASTYGIVMTAFDRYIAVIYPVWYSNNVRSICLLMIAINEQSRISPTLLPASGGGEAHGVKGPHMVVKGPICVRAKHSNVRTICLLQLMNRAGAESTQSKLVKGQLRWVHSGICPCRSKL